MRYNASPLLLAGMGAFQCGGSFGALPAVSNMAAPRLPATLRVNPEFNFPYQIPQPCYVSGYETVTGGKPLLNIGAPLALNDPTEYLRAAMVSHDWASVANWVEWYGNSNPWAEAAGRFGAPKPSVFNAVASAGASGPGGLRAALQSVRGPLRGLGAIGAAYGITAQQVQAMRGFDFLSAQYVIGANGKKNYLPLMEIESSNTKLSDVLWAGGACVYPGGKVGYPAAGPGFTRIPPYNQGGTFVYGDCRHSSFWDKWGVEIIILVAACVTAGIALASMPEVAVADAALESTAASATEAAATESLAAAGVATAGAGTATVAGSAELAEIVVTASLPSAVGAGTVAAGTVAAGAAASALASGGGSAAGNTLEEITVTPKPLPPPAALIPASVVQAAAVAATAALPALVSAPATPTPQPQPQPQPQNQLLNSAADAAGKILSNTAVKVGTTLLTGAILGTGSSTHPSAPPPQAPGMAPVVDSNGNIIGSAPIPAGQPGSLQNPSVFSTVPLWVWLVGAAVILR